MKKAFRRATCLLLLLALTGCAIGPRPSTHVPPEVLFGPPPVYPERALASKAAGLVDLSVTVDEIGLPRAVRVVHEEPAGMGFGESAADALRGWIWRPAAMEGAPVEEVWNVRLRFDPMVAFETKRLPVLLKRANCERGRDGAVRVVVAADVDGEGRPDFLEVVARDRSDEDLRAEAIRCVSSWRWAPGRPGQTYVVVIFGGDGDR